MAQIKVDFRLTGGLSTSGIPTLSRVGDAIRRDTGMTLIALARKAEALQELVVEQEADLGRWTVRAEEYERALREIAIDAHLHDALGCENLARAALDKFKENYRKTDNV